MNTGDLVVLRFALKNEERNISYDSDTVCLILKQADSKKRLTVLIEGKKVLVPIGFVRNIEEK